MSTTGFILLQFFTIFISAKLAGELFHRLKQPEVIGEILVGVLLGSHALGLIGEPSGSFIDAFPDKASATEALHLVLDSVGELGVIVLLFVVGLETRLSDLIRVGPRATVVAFLGIVVPFGLGYAFMRLVMDEPNISSVFVATAMVATSVGITARVLQELNVLGTIEARIILGAAVIDDVLALLLLTVVTGTTGTETVSAGEFAVVVAQALGFIALVILVGRRVFVRYHASLSRLHLPDAPLVVALGAMMGLAGLASFFQLAAIIGAFLAGMVFAEFPEREALNERMRPIYHFLVPFFFVLIGTEVDLRVFRDGEVVALAAGVTLLAIAGKLIGGGIAGWGMKVRSVLIISVGMVPRGEVGLIVAGIALSSGAVDTRLFSAVVIMSVVTTLVVPPLLHVLYTRQPTPIGEQSSET